MNCGPADRFRLTAPVGLVALAVALCGALLGTVGCGPRSQPYATRSSPADADLARAFAGGTWVDLTHPFDDRTIYWPTDERGFRFEAGTNGVTPKGYYYAANRFATAEHGGTHLDAPRHFAAAAATAADIPPERLVGEAAVIDVTRQCAADPAYEVTLDDLRGWENRERRQLVDMIVLLRTGWSARWGDRAGYLGTAATGADAVAELKFPGLAADAARWLVEHRRIRAVGIDTASIDHGPATLFPAHVLLCGAGVPIFENVTALELLPPSGAFVAALPMKIAGGSGGPLRVVARLPGPAAAVPDTMAGRQPARQEQQLPQQ
jgi:kynurenine formamidase